MDEFMAVVDFYLKRVGIFPLLLTTSVPETCVHLVCVCARASVCVYECVRALT